MAGVLELANTSPQQSFTEPLTLTEVKTHLNLPERSPVDANEDLLIEAYITGARSQAELCQGRDLVVKQWDLWLDCFGEHCIELRHPLVSVDLIQRRNSDGNYADLADGADYIVDVHKCIILPPYGGSWPSFTPWPSSAVQIRYSSGYGPSDVFWNDIGKLIKAGMLPLISHWFNGRLPFELGSSAIAEYPYTVTHCLSAGSLVSIG